MAASTASADLHGRVAIVTGASRGIGREIAIHLRSLGAKLVINYTSSSTQADLLASELNGEATAEILPIAVAVKADVSNPDDVRSLFDRAEQEFGTPAHILINCAGVSDPKYPAVADTTVEDWDAMFNVNARGAFLTCREAANRLARGGGGRIILISTSVVGAALPGYAAYAASKAAVEMMGKIVAKELKGSGITVNCVAPGRWRRSCFSRVRVKRRCRDWWMLAQWADWASPMILPRLLGFSFPMRANGSMVKSFESMVDLLFKF